MGKVIVIVFAAISFLILPVSYYHLANTSVDPTLYTIEFQGNFYDVKIGDFLPEKGFNFLKFIKSGLVIFSPEAWNQAFSSNPVFGLSAGTFMLILWYIAIGMTLIGIILAFFKPKISGIFFILTALLYGFQAVVWAQAMKVVFPDPAIVHFPIPIGSLFFLVVAIIAFTTKAKESYYYSPGYSYGYGRR